MKEAYAKEVSEAIRALAELYDDISVPKNVKTRIESIIAVLRQDLDMSIRINKALNWLDEIAQDNNMQSYTRTQIWNVVSLLEELNH